jgi:5-methylcytosine-specific restriction endonuclease McrA
MLIKKCILCGKNFEISSKFHTSQKYCSRDCSRSVNDLKYKLKKRKNKDMWGTKKYCIKCNKQIILNRLKPFKTEIIRKYCSEECFNITNAKRASQRNKIIYEERSLEERKKHNHENYILYRENNLIIAKKHKYKRRAMGEPVYYTKEIQNTIRKRDNFQCVYCHTKGTSINPLSNDHLIPISKGGNSEINNLFTSCLDCNRIKQNKSLEDFFKTKYAIIHKINKNTVNKVLYNENN